MKINSRERVLAAATRRKTDRLATSLRCTVEAWQKMRGYLAVRTDQEVLDTLDIDMRWISVPFIGPKERSAIPLFSEGVDFCGCRTRKVENEFNCYYEFDYHPLAEAKTVEDIIDHDWPSLDWWDYEAVETQIVEANHAGVRGISFFAGGTFETPWYMRGMEQFLVDLYESPEIIDAICSRVKDYCYQRALRVIEASKGQIDVAATGGDINGKNC